MLTIDDIHVAVSRGGSALVVHHLGPLRKGVLFEGNDTPGVIPAQVLVETEGHVAVTVQRPVLQRPSQTLARVFKAVVSVRRHHPHVAQSRNPDL